MYMYDRMRGLNLVPSVSCYHTLLDYLIRKNETKPLVRVYSDMLEMGLAERVIYENVIRVLTRVGKVQESRKLIKKSFVHGIKPSSIVLDAIVSGYCKKQDYDDLLSLFLETNCVPNVIIGNKIIHSLCQNLGVERAVQFLEQLNHLGFSLDSVTFGILIGWSCREQNLRTAFVFLSNVLSRGLKPCLNSYNALISGVFRDGLSNHAIDILHEMDDTGVTPKMSTFKVLLAGYCKARRFDDVKVMIEKMVQNGLIDLYPFEDHISKAFKLLGIDLFAIRLKRENDVGFSRTEFFDSMGNGLYLEGDVVEFDETVTRILDDSMIPDFNRVIINDNDLKSYKSVCFAINELVHWGQELSLATFSTILKRFNSSNLSFKAIIVLLDNMPILHGDLDDETLELLVQDRVKLGFLRKSRKLYDKIDRKTYSVLVNSRDLQKHRETETRGRVRFPVVLNEILEGFLAIDEIEKALNFLDKMVREDLVPKNMNFNNLLEQMCRYGRRDKAVDLLDVMLMNGSIPDSTSYDCLIREFCDPDQIDEALDLYMEMLNRELEPSVATREVLIKKLCGLGRLAEAETVLDAMVCGGQQPSEAVFASVMSRYRSEKNFLKASEILRTMQRFGYKPDFETHWSFISTLSRSSDDNRDDGNHNFLSKLLFESGFSRKTGVDPSRK